ncbi:MAG: hypothetical protein GY731_06250 [Gammaproteobacteria bacterium]|nr:hypothetical protein [Gammaproteobacteria bacterium]
MRMIAMGSRDLMDGFSLLGFDTYGDATPEQVEELLSSLLRGKEKALVFLEHELAHCNSPSLEHARREGGRIVLTEVPPLHSPDEYHPPVEELITRLLGPSALEER